MVCAGGRRRGSSGRGAAGRAAAGVALAVLVVAAGGCAHRHTAAVGWRPAEAGVGGGVQAALRKRERFGYRRADALAVERRVTRARAGMVVEDVRMAVRDPLGRLGRFEQRFIHYRWAGGGARPTVVVCPLFGDGMLFDKLVARRFCRRGFNALVVLPAEQPGDVSRPLAELDDMFIRYTIMVRMGIDMLEGWPTTDRERIYGFGISMGAIRAALAFGVEPRIRKVGLLAGGGDIPAIIADTAYGTLRAARAARMAAEAIPDLAGLRARVEDELDIDPLDFACLRDPEDVFMVIVSADSYVRAVHQHQLRRAFARPGEGRFPVVVESRAGHIVTACRFGHYVDRMAGFFGGPGG